MDVGLGEVDPNEKAAQRLSLVLSPCSIAWGRFPVSSLFSVFELLEVLKPLQIIITPLQAKEAQAPGPSPCSSFDIHNLRVFLLKKSPQMVCVFSPTIPGPAFITYCERH